MKKLFLLFFMLLCSSFLRTYAATWVQIDENHYIDKDSIKNYTNDSGDYDFNKKTFWIKSVGNDIYKNSRIEFADEIAYGLALYIINYSNNTITAKSGTIYNEEGKPLNSYTLKDFQLDWHVIVPNSNSEYWAELVGKPSLVKKLYKSQILDNK